MCDGCGCSAALESHLRLCCPNCGGDHVSTGCSLVWPAGNAAISAEVVEETIPPFLMVVTDVDEETQIVTLHSVHDWEVPCEMKWFYGIDAPCNNMLDKVGHCYTVTLKRTP